jgi:hypothetical protein
VLTRANGQPAIAAYVRTPGETGYVPLTLDVLRVRDGVVTEVVIFGHTPFAHFDLPAALYATEDAQ